MVRDSKVKSEKGPKGEKDAYGVVCMSVYCVYGLAPEQLDGTVYRTVQRCFRVSSV